MGSRFIIRSTRIYIVYMSPTYLISEWDENVWWFTHTVVLTTDRKWQLIRVRMIGELIFLPTSQLSRKCPFMPNEYEMMERDKTSMCNVYYAIIFLHLILLMKFCLHLDKTYQNFLRYKCLHRANVFHELHFVSLCCISSEIAEY